MVARCIFTNFLISTIIRDEFHIYGSPSPIFRTSTRRYMTRDIPDTSPAFYSISAVIDDYMDLQQWRTCYRSLYRVTSLLKESKNLILGEGIDCGLPTNTKVSRALVNDDN